MFLFHQSPPLLLYQYRVNLIWGQALKRPYQTVFCADHPFQSRPAGLSEYPEPGVLRRNARAKVGLQQTYLRTLSGWLYLTVVIDLADRKVLGWSFSGSLQTGNTTVAAPRMAFKNRPPRHGLIFHSDRGVQYCAAAFRDTLQALCPSVRQSMSRKGNCWDNACAESFFKTLKRELETLDGKHAEAEVRQSVFMYIEAYYNRLRLHSAFDYCAPNVFNLRVAA
jgi:transposase InsO family protein